MMTYDGGKNTTDEATLFWLPVHLYSPEDPASGLPRLATHTHAMWPGGAREGLLCLGIRSCYPCCILFAAGRGPGSHTLGHGHFYGRGIFFFSAAKALRPGSPPTRC